MVLLYELLLFCVLEEIMSGLGTGEVMGAEQESNTGRVSYRSLL